MNEKFVSSKTDPGMRIPPPFFQKTFRGVSLSGLLWAGFCGLITPGHASEGRNSQQPNVVLINLDDADRDMLEKNRLARHFPNIHSIASNGLTFTNFHVTCPLCGPSRASLVRGQYAHALDHRTNNSGKAAYTRGFKGDYLSFRQQGFADDDFGRWMQDAGYHTVFIGKYINGPLTENARLHKGWDDFYHSRHGIYYGTPRFTNRFEINGSHENLPGGVYRTHAEGLDAARLIRRQAKNNQPLFLYFSPYGPHSATDVSGGMVDEKFRQYWPNIKLPKGESYNEFHNSDKPPAYSQIPLMDSGTRTRIQLLYRQRMLATKSVDVAVGRILRALEETGRLQNTYLIVTSDNGFLLGHHRMMAKGISLTQATNVPMFVSGPGIPQNRVAGHLTAHIDIAPTLLDLAGASSKPFFDGKSFRELLFHPGSIKPRNWRDSFLVENWQTKFFEGHRIRATFVQLRMFDSVYTQWSDGSLEYYDHRADPGEMANLADTLTETRKSEFHERISNHRREMEAPITTLETPEENLGPISGPPFHLKGVAEDTSGVNQVKLVIRKTGTGRYWNGSDWQPARTTIGAYLENPGGILSDWSYRFDPGGAANLSDSYIVTARAFAQNGKSSRVLAIRRFRYDSFPPTTRIVSLSSVGRRLEVRGQAWDNQKVERIAIEIRNAQGLYFSRNGWQVERSQVYIPANPEGKWEWRSPKFPGGTYRLTAAGQDSSKNRDPSPPSGTVVLGND
ncbi:MAG: sulfatase-like hydrolase/transferase [Planctomycetota bacterium]|nr:sulfatase-like hydrolase/transferase [Planctomycetota bacterium]